MKKQYIIKNLVDNTYYNTSYCEFFKSIEEASLFDSEESAENIIDEIYVNYSAFLTIFKVYKNV